MPRLIWYLGGPQRSTAMPPALRNIGKKVVAILHAPITKGIAHWAIWIHTLAECPCHETPPKEEPREETNLQWEAPLSYQLATLKGLGIFSRQLPTQGFVHRLGRAKRPAPNLCIPSAVGRMSASRDYKFKRSSTR